MVFPQLLYWSWVLFHFGNSCRNTLYLQRGLQIATKKDKEGSGFIILDIDKVIHEPARFMIMAHLYVMESADFLFIKNQTQLTFGNLSSHLSKLEAAGYIKIEKEFLGKKPHTMISLTKGGRTAFENYHQKMSQILNNLPNN